MKKSKLLVPMMGMALLGSVVNADSLYIDASGNVGVGTSAGSPASTKFHVLDGDATVEQTGAGIASIINFTTANGNWEIKQNANTGRLQFSHADTAGSPFKFDKTGVDNLFRVGVVNSTTVDVNGTLLVNNVPVSDYVFSPEYELKTIEEQTEYMFKNKHLPAVQGGDENMRANIDVMGNQMAILEELEKAHIYISQLNETIKEMKADMAELKASGK